MELYIKKSALVAEIEKLIDKGRYHEEYDCIYRDGNNGALYALKDKLDTIEVKDFDLEKAIDKWICDDAITHDDCSITDVISTARHFFNLGLKAREGKE